MTALWAKEGNAAVGFRFWRHREWHFQFLTPSFFMQMYWHTFLYLLQEKEFQLHNENFGTVGTQAAVLAGFTMTVSRCVVFFKSSVCFPWSILIIKPIIVSPFFFKKTNILHHPSKQGICGDVDSSRHAKMVIVHIFHFGCDFAFIQPVSYTLSRYMRTLVSSQPTWKSPANYAVL